MGSKNSKLKNDNEDNINPQSEQPHAMNDLSNAQPHPNKSVKRKESSTADPLKFSSLSEINKDPENTSQTIPSIFGNVQKQNSNQEQPVLVQGASANGKIDFEALVKEMIEENYAALKEDYMKRPNFFIANNLMLCVQFFKNFENFVDDVHGGSKSIRKLKYHADEKLFHYKKVKIKLISKM